MKKTMLVMSLVLSIMLSACTKEKLETDYKIITTTFSDHESHLLEFSNGKVINDKMYEIRGVEYYNNENQLLIYSAYDNQIINTKTSESFEIPYNPYDMIDYGDERVMIHTNGLNEYNVIRYDKNFNIVKKSTDLLGIPNQMLFYDGQLLILNNRLDDDYNRRTEVSVVNPDNLTLIDRWVIEDMIFGFNMEVHNDKLSIFGHNSFDNENLYLATIELENFSENYMEFEQSVMWITDGFYKNDLLYVVNEYSVIVINGNNKIVNVFESELSIIDLHYVKDDLIYILQGDYDKHLFEVVTINNEFEIANNYPITEVDTKPTRIIVE